MANFWCFLICYIYTLILFSFRVIKYDPIPRHTVKKKPINREIWIQYLQGLFILQCFIKSVLSRVCCKRTSDSCLIDSFYPIHYSMIYHFLRKAQADWCVIFSRSWNRNMGSRGVVNVMTCRLWRVIMTPAEKSWNGIKKKKKQN